MSIHKGKNGWAVRWRAGGRHRSRLIGTKRDAELFDAEMKRRSRMGVVGLGNSEQDFHEFAQEWWRVHKAGLKPATQDYYHRSFECHILPFFDAFRLCDVTPGVVGRFKASLEEGGVGHPTQAKALAILHTIFNAAVLNEQLISNPVSPVKKPPGYRQRLVQPFPPERVEAIRSHFLSDGALESATYVSVLAYSGSRPAEAQALTWGDVGNDHIIYRASKTERDRQTRLLAPLRDDLRAWQKDTGVVVGRVFDWPESRHRNWSRRHFKAACSAIGIEVARPYDLRHAFVTLLTGEGRRVDYIARQLGHSIETCERHYRHLIEDLGKPQDAEDRIYSARNVPPMYLKTSGKGGE